MRLECRPIDRGAAAVRRGRPGPDRVDHEEAGDGLQLGDELEGRFDRQLYPGRPILLTRAGGVYVLQHALDEAVVGSQQALLLAGEMAFEVLDREAGEPGDLLDVEPGVPALGGGPHDGIGQPLAIIRTGGPNPEPGQTISHSNTRHQK